jgi:hypothetical protein
MIKLIIVVILFVIINFLFNEAGLFKCKEGIVIFAFELNAFAVSVFAVLYPFKD